MCEHYQHCSPKLIPWLCSCSKSCFTKLIVRTNKTLKICNVNTKLVRLPRLRVRLGVKAMTCKAKAKAKDLTFKAKDLTF